MKKARRFMAMLLFLTLCIIPLSLSVQAYDDCDAVIMTRSDHTEIVSCPHCGSDDYVVESMSSTYIKYIGTEAVCYAKYYYTLYMRCWTCQGTGTENNVLWMTFTHSNIHYTTEVHNGREITAWHCPTCDYYHN